ncbi:interferon-inducible double-stranded RNA-dependent protein kinase activator A homolog [Apis cerana]|uniref:interferon-inducible double-stranded RNA-dependent protein kinase activator A homolog n=1 Tax=Apis cerana TaxID=7461 RepID=UPI0007E2D06E|nr:interferon-inducible double-stranded RNA-dependent protein kinase activator A homolog [Apis cerana]
MNKTPVSILQEMMIKNKITPNYELIHDGGGSHMNVFAYQVKCDDLIASGIGRSKKDAKHEAAKAMLEIIATHRGYLQLPASPAQSPVRTPLPPTIPEIPRIPPDIPFVNAVGALQDLCVENNLQDPKYQQISDVGPPHAKIFTIECEVATLKEIGIAKTKKQAKQEAAKKMLDKLSDLVPDLNNISDKKKQNIDQEMENSNKIAKAQYTKLSKLPAAKKVNLGVKLSEYHIQFKSQYDDETRKEIIERILSVIPSNQNHVSEECIEHLIKKFEDILIDIGLDFTSLCIPSSENIIVAMRINTCPSIVELALGETKSETKLRALQKMIDTTVVFLT